MCLVPPTARSLARGTSMAPYSQSAGIGTSVVHYTERSWTYMRTYLPHHGRDRRSVMASPASALNLAVEAKEDLLTVLQESDHDGRDWGEWADELYEAYELLTRAVEHIAKAQLTEL